MINNFYKYNTSRNFELNKISDKKLSFGKSEQYLDSDIEQSPKNIVVPQSQKSYKKLLNLEEKLNQIINDIGGIDNKSGILNDIEISQAKIKRLSDETKQSWGSCLKVLQSKISELNNLSKNLQLIEEEYKQISDSSLAEKPEIILPNNSMDNFITDSLEIMAIYNMMPENFVRQMSRKNQDLLPVDVLTAKELKNSLSELDKENWNYIKLNQIDSKVYSKLKDSLIIGDIKKVVSEQISDIDVKLDDLKNNGFFYSKDTNLKVYSPDVTGKILALETAKLRRTVLSQSIAIPELYHNLDKPDILIQQTPVSKPLVFKIDTLYTPKKYEINEILSLNKPFKPVLDKLFPDGLNLYIVPGYLKEKYGNLNGGESIPGHPDTGIWLNSYNYDKKNLYMSNLEKAIAVLRGVQNFTPSVMNGKVDRARALAHELGHVISYKIINNDNSRINQSDTFCLSLQISFLDGWRGLRIGAKSKLNGDELNARQNRFMSDSDKKNLNLFVDYEMMAEDIRLAINGDNIPASSKMSGVFDQSKDGKAQYEASLDYIKKCLIEDKRPTDVLFYS